MFTSIPEPLEAALSLTREMSAPMSARWVRWEPELSWRGGPRVTALCKYAHLLHTSFNHLLVSLDGELFIVRPPGLGRAAAERPSSATDVAGALEAYRCPALDGSWTPPAGVTFTNRGAILEQEQGAGRFTSVSLRDALAPWLLELAPGELQAALPVLHAISFWPAKGGGLFEPTTLHDTWESLPSSIRDDLERCEVLERHELIDDERSLLVAPGALPPGPIGADASGFLHSRHTHQGESDGFTESVYFARLDRLEGSWRLERSLVWQKVRRGRALS